MTGSHEGQPALPGLRIDSLVLPVTAVAVAGAIGIYASTRMPPALPVGALEGFAFLLSFCLATSFFPVIATIFGWHSRKPFRALLVGLIPFPALFLAGILIFRPSIPPWDYLYGTIQFIVAISAVSGLAGFFAAQKARSGPAVSFLLIGLWIFLWMNAFR